MGLDASDIDSLVKTAIKDLLKEFAPLGQFQNANHDAQFFEAFVAGVFKIVARWVAEIVDFIRDDISSGSRKLSDVLGELIDAIIKELNSALKDLGNFPVALTSGPLDALNGVRGVSQLLSDLCLLPQLKTRVTVAGNSIAQLFEVLAQPKIGSSGTDSDAGSYLLIKTLIDQVVTVINDLIGQADAKTSLQKVLIDTIFPVSTLKQVLATAAKGNLWAWAELPAGLPIGRLNAWLNDPRTYPAGADTSLERQFRVRLVAAVDAYVRGKTKGLDPAGTLTDSDGREAALVLSDVTCLFFDNVFHFIFEPECFPIEEVDLDGIEDIGVKFANLVAREIRIAIRALIGLLFRGAWAFTINNKVLIEFIASLFASFFSAIIEAVLRNLTWSLQIVSCYPKALFGDATVGDVFQNPPPQPLLPPLNTTLGGSSLIYFWPSMETIGNTRAPADRLWYVAIARMPLCSTFPNDSYPWIYNPGEDPVNNPTDPLAFTRGLLRDFGAYIDVSYQRFKFESRFPQIATTDKVTITRSEVLGGKLTVWATTSATFDQPQPVLRAYFCCDVVVLRPGASPADPYVAEVPLHGAPRCFEVLVLSNGGGVARRRVTR
jgi:hypothetical protein